MKILNLFPTGKFDGCFKVRNYTPFKQLRRLGHTVDMGQVKGRFDYDIVVWNRAFPFESSSLTERIKSAGAKVVYDVDDIHPHLSPTNFFSSQRETKQALKLSKTIFKYVDMVTVTTSQLKKEMMKIVDVEVVVLPNCLYPMEWKERQRGNKRLKVGYAGSVGHLEDLLLIIDVIKNLQRKHNFEFYLMGIFPKAVEEQLRKLKTFRKPEWAKIGLKLLKKLKEIDYINYPFVDTKIFPETLTKMNFDIGLCPLVDNRFNRSKSCIKFYEYSAVGTVTLASDVLPYKDEVNYLAKNTKDWHRKLEALLIDEKLRDNLLSEQREWVFANRDITKNIHLWEEAYRRCLN